ncbi:signal peptidase II [Mucilaginibacter sp. HMF5004]|uniref:signal peptidase II n=1 Tax=Mucilaginibacter rivuli TaxID=2857527 RepID=UPI001C5D22F6|nr:signal peptidase II [Mucilaginibacter rivuli]MBW4889804.1 signal peptidase II [Mucilaginibacter rivuli]
MQFRFKIILFCLVSVVFIGCDRYTKELAKTHLMNHPDISYFHNTIRLEYAENTGAALSLGDSLPKAISFWALSIMPLALMVALLVYTIRKANELNRAKVICLALIFAGGMGNLIDRIFFDRHVTDFMNIGIQNLRTGIFNVADVCITVGAIGMMLFFTRREPQTLVEV